MADTRWKKLYREYVVDVVLAVALAYIFTLLEAGSPSIGVGSSSSRGNLRSRSSQ
jgi:hypothetical protein